MTGARRIQDACKMHLWLRRTALQAIFCQLFQQLLIVFAKLVKVSPCNYQAKSLLTAIVILTAWEALWIRFSLGENVAVSYLKHAIQTKVSRERAPMTILKRMSVAHQIISTELSTSASLKRPKTLRRRFWRTDQYLRRWILTQICSLTPTVFTRAQLILLDSRAATSWKWLAGKTAMKVQHG